MHSCEMTHPCGFSVFYFVLHHAYIHVIWRIHVSFIHSWDMTPPFMRHDSSMYTRDMTHLYVLTCALSLLMQCVTWPFHLCDMTNPYIRVTWLMCMFRLVRCHWWCNVWHDPLIHATLLIHIYTWYDSYVCFDSRVIATNVMCEMIDSFMRHDSSICTCDHTHVYAFAAAKV